MTLIKRSIQLLAVNAVITFFVLGLLGAAHATMVEKLKANNADEEQIYNILVGIKDHISAGDWDKWLDLYADEAKLTSGVKKITYHSKEEMRVLVKGATYIISEMELLDLTIEGSEASASVRMIGNGNEHFETYTMKKKDGKWLIYEEANP